MIDLRRHDFSSLSVRDLLDGREAFHVYLAHLDRVFATAIGKYLIRKDDKNFHDAGYHTPSGELGARTLTNASPREWSWPCVLVFVRDWLTHEDLAKNPSKAAEMVPPYLILPDDRVIPTCVVLVDPQEEIQAVPKSPVFKSDLVGGGFPVQADVQNKTHVGSIACLVTDGDAVYALTNRHVTGEPGRELFAGFANTDRRLGVTSPYQLGKLPFSEAYPGWPGLKCQSNLDAGLIRIDDVSSWSAQAYGIGEIGDIWDLNVDNFRLDIINRPVIAFGSISGEMKGRILGLFYRYKTVGGMEYVTDFVIGPRGELSLNNYPGDSGTLWFEDDEDAPKNAQGARRLRPFALEWGGQVLLAPGGKTPTQLALGVCLATVCRELDIQIIPDWNIGHTEYWGEWGHVKIGAYATSLIDSSLQPLADLMSANAGNIGLGDDLLQKLPPYHKGDFSPLADVADLVWRTSRPNDESNHFADMDKAGADGKTLLEHCRADPAYVDPDKWNSYYEGIGENAKRGALPFRVWQIAEAMAGYAAQGQWLEFVCAGGIVAHYIGDACQPLHISQYHHGRDMSDPKQTKVHSVYETTMVGRYGSELIKMIPTAAGVLPVAEIKAGSTPTGHDIAVSVVALMQRTVDRLPPLTIVDEFDDHMGTGQVETMWNDLGPKTAACMQDGARALARVWEAAYRAGLAAKANGWAAPTATTFKPADLSALYQQKTFLPSYTLQQITTSNGKIVPAGSAQAPAPHPPARRPVSARP
jgi:hypothetical protein